MKTRPLTDATFEDAKSVILARFPVSALEVLAKTMSNPLRADCSEIGDIAYDETDRPVGFRAANRRRMHFCGDVLLGRVRGLTCRLKDSSKDVLPALCEAQLSSPRGCTIAYSNTQSLPTERRAIQMGATLGPESCTRMLCGVVRPVAFLVYSLLKRVAKIDLTQKWKATGARFGKFEQVHGEVVVNLEDKVDKKFFDQLMAEYLRTNRGLVSDRDGDTVLWLFGNEIADGRVVILGARLNDKPIGYIALKTEAGARHWLVVDLFAIKNDKEILGTLLRSATSFLRENTPALVCKVIGFPTYVQPLLRKYFPHVRKTGVNWFSYNFLDASLSEKCVNGVDCEGNWFFGPFDGDFCM